MAGLIQENMAGQGGDQLTPDVINAQIKMPPELQKAYERVVVAGMKIMFSKETHDKAIRAIEGPGPVDKRLATGVAGLVAELFRQSNGTIPQAVLIPAATNLLGQAADFLRKTGQEQVDDKTLASAMHEMINIILDMFGVDPQKMASALDMFDKSEAAQKVKQQMGAQA